MRLKLIGVYGLLILALGAFIWLVLDVKLHRSQYAALRTAADRATAHTRRALDAEAMELVALAGRAASVPELVNVVEQWRAVMSVDTGKRWVQLFLTASLEEEQRKLFERLAKEKGVTIAGASPGATAAPAAAPAPGAGPAAPPAPPTPAPATSAKRAPTEAYSAKRPAVLAASLTPTKAGMLSAKAAPAQEQTKAPVPAPPPAAGPGQTVGAPAAGAPQPGAARTPPAAPAAVPAATGAGQAAPGQTPPPTAGPAGTPPSGEAARPADQPPEDAAATEPEDRLVLCEKHVCTEEELKTLYEVLAIGTLLGEPKLGYEECRKAYLPDLEADLRRIVDEQLRKIEEERAASRPGRQPTRGQATAPELQYPPTRQFDPDKYPACASFISNGLKEIAEKMARNIFDPAGYKAVAKAYKEIAEMTRLRVEFIWLLDRDTGQGIARNTEYSATTTDGLYYTKTLGELFEGLGNAEKVLRAVRSGAVYRDIWVTQEKHRDALTAFLHAVMVPVIDSTGTVAGLLALAVKTENLARVARDAKAKVVLARKTARDGVETIQIVGDGNDDEKVESLPEEFRKKVEATFNADLRAVAGIPATDPEGKGLRPPRDFEYGGTRYWGRAVGLTNDVRRLIRDDASASFAVGHLALVVLVDKTQAMEVLASIWLVWLLTGIAIVIAILAALFIAQSLLRPITEIEDGLLRIMNGDWTHRFDVQSAELGGLSYRINQLMAALLGDEEEEGGEAAGEEEAPPDPREAYYRRLYEKFQATQRQIGVDPNSVPYADFRARLEENERKILEKNPGRTVEFEILVQGNQITFKPILK